MIRHGLVGAALAALVTISAAAAGDRAAEPPAPPSPGAARKSAGDPLLLSAAALARLEAMRGTGGRTASGTPMAPAAPRILHLSAIIHHGPKDWRIWLNGESLTPASPSGPVRVLEVTPAAVVLAWRPPGGGEPVRVRLYPNQSYLIDSGRIIEGRPPRVASATVGSAAAPLPDARAPAEAAPKTPPEAP